MHAFHDITEIRYYLDWENEACRANNVADVLSLRQWHHHHLDRSFDLTLCQ